MNTFETVDFSTTSRLIRHAIEQRELAELARHLKRLSTAEVLAQFDTLSQSQLALAYRMLPKASALEVFELLDPLMQADLLETLQGSTLSEIFAALDPDDRVALLDELPAGVAAKLLKGLNAEQRGETNVLLGYAAGVVGHVMSPNVLTTHPDLSVEHTLDRVQAQAKDAESITTVMVIDESKRLLGTVSLRTLLAADAAQPVSELMEQVAGLPVNTPAGQAARQTLDTRALAIPVQDLEGRLVGVLSLEQAIRLTELEDEQRSAHGSGTAPLRRPYLNTPISSLVRSRLIWLLVLGIGASLTVQVLSSFEQTLESVVMLSLFIPLVVGIGGNTGNQAATTLTRAIAMGEVRPAHFARILLREARVGAILGCCLGGLGFGICALIFGLQMGLIIGITLVVLCTLAAAVGGAMPLLGKMLKVDPAVFSNPFISTFVDAAGLLVYFSVAMTVLRVFGA